MAGQSDYWNRFWRRRLSRRRVLQAAALGGAGLAVAGVLGCEDERPPTSTPTAILPPGASPAATPTPAEPKFGGTHRGPLVGLRTTNPSSLAANTRIEYTAQIPAAFHCSRLVKFAPGRIEDVNGFPSIQIDFSNAVGDAVESVPEVVDGGTVLNFKLRDNLNFHDVPPVNGRPVTAEDVKLAIDRFAAESSTRLPWLRAVEGIRVTGDKTFSISLRRPFAPAFQVLFGNNEGGPWIIPQEVVEQDLLNTNPIGSGPWIFEEWQPGVAIRWRKNPDYYDAPKPYMDGVEAALISDPDTILQNLREGTFDATLWEAQLWDLAREELPDAIFSTGPEHIWGGATFNLSVPPFDKKEVRQALSMAIDREGILKATDQPGAAASLTHISQFDRFWMDPLTDPAFGPNAKYYKRDVAEAKRLLGAAGYPDGVDLQAISAIAFGPAYADRMEALGLSAREAGFRMQFNLAEYGTWISTTYLGDIPENALGIHPLLGSPMDPHLIFFFLFHPTSGRHSWGPPGAFAATELPRVGENSPAGDVELLDLWDAQVAELHFEARIEIVREIQRVMAESMWLIPWPGVSIASIFNPWVKNLRHTTRGFGYGVETAVNLWLDRG